MLDTVKAWIERHDLCGTGGYVLAACSGGPDSIALVHILNTVKAQYGFTLAVAHVDHMLRGRESEQDAEFVEGFCRQLALPLYQTQICVREFAGEEGLSTQEAARLLRFRFLRKTAQALGGARIATGHHRDDQAETVLINLLRGAGSSGLKGMRAQENGIIRPLLAVSRSEVAEYCRANCLEYRTDSSNLSTKYLRNRVRLELLPYLAEHYNPNVTEALWRVSQIAADEHAYIRRQAEHSGVIRCDGDRFFLDKKRLSANPLAVQREIVRLVLEKIQGHLKGISFDHVEKIVGMAACGQVGSVMPLPGKITVRVGYQAIEFGQTALPSRRMIKPPGIELTIPGRTDIPELGIQVQADIVSTKPVHGAAQAVFDWDALRPPVCVRTRTDGDRFQPLGMAGTKKIKDYFIDEKVPREERDQTAVFTDRQGIIWLGGYRQSELGKTCGNTMSFLRLNIVRQEEM